MGIMFNPCGPCCGTKIGGRFYNCITNVGYADATVTVTNVSSGFIYATLTTDSGGNFSGPYPVSGTGTVTVDIKAVDKNNPLYTNTVRQTWTPTSSHYANIQLGATLSVSCTACHLPVNGLIKLAAGGTVVTVTGPGNFNGTCTTPANSGLCTSPFNLVVPGTYTIVTVYQGIRLTNTKVVAVCNNATITICVGNNLLATVVVDPGCNGGAVGTTQIVQNGTIVDSSRALVWNTCIPAGVNTQTVFIPDSNRHTGGTKDWGTNQACGGLDLWDRSFLTQGFPVPTVGYVCGPYTGRLNSGLQCNVPVSKTLTVTDINLGITCTLNYTDSGLGTYNSAPVTAWAGSASYDFPGSTADPHCPAPACSVTLIYRLYNYGPFQGRFFMSYINNDDSHPCNPICTPLGFLDWVFIDSCAPGLVVRPDVGSNGNWIITE